jgi:DNA polymerase-2
MPAHTACPNEPYSPGLKGWLLDLYAAPAIDGLTAWLALDTGERLRLEFPFPITFYVAGPSQHLRAAWQALSRRADSPSLARTERREIFQVEPVTVLAVQCRGPRHAEQVFRDLLNQFPELDYYDVNINLAQRAAASWGVFPLGLCQVDGTDRQVQRLASLETPWQLDPPAPALRILRLEPDCDPGRREPSAVLVSTARGQARLSLSPARALCINLRAFLKRHDPDLLLTAWGDTWLLPRLIEMDPSLPLNRDLGAPLRTRPAHSYFSYGQIVYKGQQVQLAGRWHIDRRNALLYDDFDLEGIYEFARVTALPVQDAARLSPGTGISSMQIITALRQGILVPWRKQEGEHLRPAIALLRRDQGGLIYQPTPGLHTCVAGIDFVSMYPGLMVRYNISPETAGNEQEEDWENTDGSMVEAEVLQRLGNPGQTGLVPMTLAPLLEKRIALKTRMANTPAWRPERKLDQARSAAHKWLLVTCFGYLGYQNARFGRIEAHEAVTAFGREALLRAKDAAEDSGCKVLHLYVDGLWLQHPTWRTSPDYQPLLEEIARRTGLSISLEGIYRWVAFLTSRMDERVAVANRYFGVFEDGSVKVRGIAARRRDTPPWIGDFQMALLTRLAQAPSAAELPACLGAARGLVKSALSDLAAGCVPIEALALNQRLTRLLEAYRAPSPAALAAQQLQAVGKTVEPGQRVRFVYTIGHPGVTALDLPGTLDPRCIDRSRYRTLLLRAAREVLEPVGLLQAIEQQSALPVPLNTIHCTFCAQPHPAPGSEQHVFPSRV